MYYIKTSRARIAVRRGDALAAGEFLRQAKNFPLKGSKEAIRNTSY
jgi:hypothetical protein